VPYKTRLTGWLISYDGMLFRRNQVPVGARKAHIVKNEGFGANTPDPSPILAFNQSHRPCAQACPQRAVCLAAALSWY
jgi:hypothetical protein